MKHPAHDPVLKEVLRGSEPSNFRQAALEHGLAALRRRRRQRLALRASGLAAAAAFAALAIMIDKTDRSVRPSKAPVQHPVAVVPAAGPPSRQLKVISDEELFALFPGRAMALIGKPGHQEFVFLDGKTPRREIR